MCKIYPYGIENQGIKTQGKQLLGFFCLLGAVCISLPLLSFSQTNDCGNNAGFETGTSAGWVCKYGSYGSGACPATGACPAYSTVLNNIGCINANGINGSMNTGTNRHTIVTGAGTDPNSLGAVTYVAPGGGNYSFRLGDAVNGGTASGLPQAEAIRLSFLVTPASSGFTYKYAAFLQYAGHTPELQPRFEIIPFDSSGNIIPCGHYQVVSGSSGNCPGTATYHPGAGFGVDQWYYTNWTSVGLDFTSYMGQVVSIEFRTSDCFGGGGYITCNQGVCTTCSIVTNQCCPDNSACYPFGACGHAAGTHSAYAYIDAYCNPVTIAAPKVCAGVTSMQICAPAGYLSYSWPSGQLGISGSPTTQCVTVTNPVPGTVYNVNMMSVTGCPASTTVTLQGTDATVADTTLCYSPTGNVALAVSPTVAGTYSYSWTGPSNFSSTLQNTSIAIPSQTSTYTVVVTDGSGCSVTKTMNVIVNPPPVVTVNNPAICTGATAQLNATGGTTYSWSPSTGLSNPNIANPTANPTSTTNYTVTITGANGCKNSAPASVTVNPVPVVTVNSPTICTGANAQLNATGGTTYAWSPATGLSNPNISNPVANPTSTTNYIVTVTDANGCVNTAPTSVTVNPLPVVTVNSPTICAGANAQLNATGGTTYVWSPATGLSNPNIANPIANPTSTTNYTVTVTNANGCVNTAPTSVTVNPLPVVTVNSPTICTGANTQLNASGGTTYVWSPATGLSNPNIANPVANPTSTTNYTVTVTNANSCVNTAPTSVTVNPLPIVTVNSPTICTGANAQLNANGGTTYVWSPATGLSNPNIANPVANPTSTTTYTVTVTDANGCVNTAPAAVTVNPLPVVTVNSPTICTGANAQLNASGGTTYVWSPATGLSNPNISNPVANPTSTTNYIVTVTDANGCVNTAPASVTVNPLPVVTVNSPTICTGGNAQLNASGGTTYVWSPATGLSNPNIANPLANPTSTTNYIVTVTDANGCVNTAPTSVTVNPLPVITVNSPTICTGANAQLNASGGTTYVWSPATGLSNPNIANPVANPTSTTSYTVTVTDANGCVNTAPTSVTVNPLPVVTVNSPTICTGANAQLNATGGTTYQWSPTIGLSNPNISNPVANPTSTTNYIVTVTDANGCVNSAPTAVTVNPLPVVTVNSPTICTGATAQLNASGGTTYAWSPATGLSNPNISNPLANPTSTTNYTVTVTNANGCVNTAPTSVTVNPLPVVTVNSPTICTGANAQLNATGGTTYQWSPVTGLSNANISNPVANPTSTTNYTVTVTDANGCVNTAPASVIVNPLPVVTVNNPTICTGATAQLNASGGTAYLWLPATGLSNPNIANPLANPTTTTNYTVTVTDANGCINTAPASVTVNPLPVITVNSPTICTGANAQLNASGGTTYLWSPATSLSNPNISNPVANPTSTTNYIVTVTDANGCVNTAPTSVTVNPLPVITVNSPTICTGATVQLNATGGTTYQWLPATGLSNPNIANPVANPTSTTTYTVTVTDANGCVNTAPAAVTVNPLPVVTVNSPTICTGTSAQLNASGGTNYLWSPATGLSNPNIANPVANPISTTNYIVTVTDANGCINTAPTSVTVNPLPVVTVNSPTICTGANAQLNASGGTTYVWSPATGLSNPNIANPVANPTSTTSYTVTVTDANGCVNTALASVTVNPLPVVTVNSPTICTGATAQLNATGGTTYVWSPATGLSNPNIANPVANPTSTTTYTVTVTDANGCINTAPTSVTVNPLPVVTVNSPTICTGANAQLNATGGTTYLWSPSTGLSNPNIANPTANPTSTTNYTVTVTNANGCVNTAPASVIVNPLPVVTVNSPTICTGANAQLNASGGTTYVWSPATGLSNPNIANPVANPTSTTNYTVTVTDANGCVNTAPASVTVNPLPVVTVNSPTICTGTSVQLSATGGSTYLWSPATGLSNPNISNPVANPLTTTSYTVTVTNTNGCVNTAPTSVFVNALLVVTVNSPVICNGSTAQLSASGGIIYTWTPSTGLSNPYIANPLANVATTTNYTVSVTDINGCRNSVPTTVTVNPLPVVSVNSATICSGHNAQLSASGGTAYSWSPAMGLSNSNIANPIANPTITTNYSVTVTDANGCRNSAPTSVTVNPLPVISVNSPTICMGTTVQLSASGGTIYSWSPATGLNNPNIANPLASPASTTNYTVTVTNANGCVNTAPTTVSVNALLSVTVNSPVMCAGATAQLSASGGTIYSWTPATGLSNPNISSPVANPTTTTNYTVYVTDANGCHNSAPTSITVNPLPVISVNSPTICAGTNTQLIASGGTNYLWSPAAGLSNPNIANPIANPTSTTNYTVTVTNIFGCSNTSPTSVTVNPLPVISVNSPTICTGTNVQLSASGGITYSWSPATGLSNPNIANPIANPITTTNYTVTVTNANGCVNSAPTSVSVNALLAVTVNSPVICAGSTAQLNASGGTIYSWTPATGLSNPNIANPLANPATTTNYTVYVTDANGCHNSAPTSVTVNPLPVVSVNSPTICTGANAQLNATGGTSYLWSPTSGLSNPNISNPIANPTSTSTYTVTVTDANGCVNSAPTSVTVNPLPVITVNNPTICTGTSTQLNATGGTTYLWSPAIGLSNPNIANPVANPTSTTSYTVTVTDANGCVNTAPTSITVNPLPVVSVNSPTICAGTNAQLSATGGTTYSWSPAFGLNNPNIATPTAHPTTTTNYTVTVTNSNGCVNIASTAVNVNPLPVISVNSPTICTGTSVQLSASGGTMYSWSPPAGLSNPNIANPMATVTSTTNYTVTVTNANGCVNTAPTSVYVNALLVVAINHPVICNGSAAQLSASGGTIYTWTPATGLNNPYISNPIANISTTTNYTVSVTDANGCHNTVPASVTVNPVPVALVNSATICSGHNAQLSANGGTTYSWSPAIGLNNPNIANPIANPTTTTNYIVTVTNSYGCSNTAPALVTVNPVPVISVNSPSFCKGASAQLIASGGTTYSWSPVMGLSNPNIANPIASPTSTTNYTVTVTNSFGCSNSAPTSVTVNPLPVITVNSPTICNGSTAQMSATGGTTYLWSPVNGLSNPNIANPIANPTSTTNYTVAVTNSFGCNNTAPASVTVNPLPVISVNSPTICAGASALLIATGGATYSWSPATGLSNPNIANPIANPSSTTNYTVTVTGANGCKNTAPASVTVNSLPVVTVNQPTICFGATAQLSASGGTIYSWTPSAGLSNPNIANPMANPIITSSYTVMVTDANGCKNKAATMVHVNTLPVVTVNQPTICAGANAQLSATGGTIYSWTPASGLNNPNIANPVANPTITSSYTVIVTNANGCSNKGVALVKVNPLPVITVNQPSICIGAHAQLNATGGTTYLWTPSTGLSNPNIANPLADPTATTTYTVKVTDSKGCTNTAPAKVTVNPLPMIVAPNAAICYGQYAQLSASGGVNYTWSPSAGLSNIHIPNPLATIINTSSYTVAVMDSNGCVNKASVKVTVNPLPHLTVCHDTALCAGDSVRLKAIAIGSSATYSWIPSTGLDNASVANPLARPNSTITYTVEVTDVNGCTASKPVTIIIHPLPVAKVGPDQNICLGQQIKLHAEGGDTYSWSPPKGLSNTHIADPLASPDTTTLYTVRVTTGSTCKSAADSVTVTVYPIPTVSAGSDTTIQAGTSVTLHGSGTGITLKWYYSPTLSCLSCADPVADPMITTAYVITTVNNYGCRVTDTVVVNIEDILTLFVPSAFTPRNHDDKNNIFYAYGVGIYRFEFYIFNRWGQQIFESHDQYVGWDGTYLGVPAQQDVYVWLAKATSITGKSISKTGTVTIVY